MNTPDGQAESMLDSYIPRNESQEKAKKLVDIVSKLAIGSQGNFQEPILVSLDGGPGLGKTHLRDSLVESLTKANIPFTTNKGNAYFLQSGDYKSGSKNIVILDDILQEYQTLSEIGFPKNQIFAKQFADLIFDVYDHKKMLFMTSNFDISEILDFVISYAERKPDEKTGGGHARLQSRIDHLRAHNTHITIKGDDYRKTLANKGGMYMSLFNALNSDNETDKNS